MTTTSEQRQQPRNNDVVSVTMVASIWLWSQRRDYGRSTRFEPCNVTDNGFSMIWLAKAIIVVCLLTMHCFWVHCRLTMHSELKHCAYGQHTSRCGRTICILNRVKKGQIQIPNHWILDYKMVIFFQTGIFDKIGRGPKTDPLKYQIAKLRVLKLWEQISL